jgi:hypothetical protein
VFALPAGFRLNVALKTLLSPIPVELREMFAEPKHVSGRDSKKAIVRFTHQNTSGDFQVEVMDPDLRCLLTPKTSEKLKDGWTKNPPTAKTYRLTFTYHAKSIRDRLGLAIFSDCTYSHASKVLNRHFFPHTDTNKTPTF